MNRRLILILGAAMLAGCATTTRPIPAPAGAPMEELEPLYSAKAGREALTIRVASNGCTQKADFAFYVDRKGEAVRLAFGRRKLDPCRSFAMGHADLTFSYVELGLSAATPIFLLNPFAAWRGPGE